MKKETKQKVLSASKTLLIIMGTLGFVFVAAAAGNAVQLLKYTPLMKRSKLKTFEINQGIKRLLNRGLIEIKEDKNHKWLKVTDKGRNLLLKYELESLIQEKPKKWDKKYRVVIFDISEERKKTRDRLRRILKSFGFTQLQGSVWVYPYDCQEIIDLLKQYLNLNDEAIYMTVESIENDKRLRESFKL
ncbi:MAG: CRISPR-associated endonuclease Cas2 [Candidatus Zambryskibacteria bacterium]|nr:CRISPR-associated endonuclease Cas2 [Candidatus Zambryskibacteria bacterium]